MADFYTQFSEIYEFKPEAAEWFKAFMATPPEGADDLTVTRWLEEHGVEDVDYWPGFGYSFTPEGHLWIHSDESGNVDNVAVLLQAYLKKFDPTACMALKWAGTCSKLRAGEFGGGAVVVTARKVHWETAWDWASRVQKRHVEQEAKRLSKKILASSKRRSSPSKKPSGSATKSR